MDGNIDDLRRRLRDFVRNNPSAIIPPGTDTDSGTSAPRLAISKNERTLQPGTPRPDDDRESYFSINELPVPAASLPEPAQAIEQIQKWGCHFDSKDPIIFLEYIEELQDAYCCSGTQLLLGLPELLREEPLLWYRNHRHSCAKWEDFCSDFRAQYFPRRYQTRLHKEAANRHQQPGESFVKFATALLTLTRRAGNFSEHEQIKLLIENMDPECRMFIRPDDAVYISELSEQVAEYEKLNKQQKNRARKESGSTYNLAAATYNRDECVWRCKQRGHTRFDCKRPPRKFCSRCGKDSVFTRDCHLLTGNANRTKGEKATDRSQ